LRDDIIRRETKRNDIQTNDFDVVFWVGRVHMLGGIPQGWTHYQTGEGFNRQARVGEGDDMSSEFDRDGLQCRSTGYFQIPGVKWRVNLLLIYNTYKLSPQTLVENADLNICAIAWDGNKLTVGENFLRDIQAKQVCLQNPSMFGESHASYARSHQRAIGFAKRFGFENKVSAMPPWPTVKPQGSGRYLFSDYD
jgi:hypothetical protein